MKKRLNLECLSSAMDEVGLSQAAIAKQLFVSRESVRKWISGQSFPRPDKLVRLGRLLNLSFSELVVKVDIAEPVVAFRKARGTKTRDHHIQNAQTMGRMLRHIVNYLPFDVLSMPPVLKDPRCEYDYLQNASKQVRQEIRVAPTETIDFHHLIRQFSKLQAVVIPVLWGSKKVHENATHIYLPDSQTTWVYLNLDVNIHDFKFWMAHELGHCLAPNLRGDEAEDFADAFAGTLLFPDELARNSYKTIFEIPDSKSKLHAITDIAEEHTISPLTVYKQINFYAESRDFSLLKLEPQIYRWMSRVNKKYMNVSDSLFEKQTPPEPSNYLDVINDVFKTPFFAMLTHYLKEHRKGPGFVQTVMDIPLLDAQGLYDALT